MDKRPESRVSTQLLVRVWGLDSQGRPFFQNVNASNLSNDGAMLLGISHPLKAGDIIGLQHEERKARFKVVWVIDNGKPREIEAGIQVLPGQRAPWEEMVPGERKMIPTGKNKRRFVRHKIIFPIEIGFEDSRRSRMQTNATDIGGRGCYVETLLPLGLGTKVNVTFWMDSNKVVTSGIVRASDPGVGMGIEFTSLDNPVQESLQQYLDKLNEGMNKDTPSAKGASNV